MVLQDPRYALNPVKNVAAQLEEALTLHQSCRERSVWRASTTLFAPSG
jgi:peptide/nickel transport system ATP-binding protein